MWYRELSKLIKLSDNKRGYYYYIYKWLCVCIHSLLLVVAFFLFRFACKSADIQDCISIPAAGLWMKGFSTLKMVENPLCMSS